MSESHADSSAPALIPGAHLTARDALDRLPTPGGARFVTLFEHGTLQVEFYAPRGVDPQQPHTRDEVYVILSGTGTFVHEATRTPFGPGDCIFVPAGHEHRFEDFTDDFGTWVLFYGPQGGEAPQPSGRIRQMREVERKFIVHECPPLGGLPVTEIEQGYLARTEDTEVRLRRLDANYWQTVKHGRGQSREETEVALTRAQFESLWPATVGRRLRKQRYMLDDGGHCFEIDVYAGSLEGLVVAEIEFQDETAAESFEPPPWLGPDVTGEAAFANYTLATEGWHGDKPETLTS